MIESITWSNNALLNRLIEIKVQLIEEFFLGILDRIVATALWYKFLMSHWAIILILQVLIVELLHILDDQGWYDILGCISIWACLLLLTCILSCITVRARLLLLACDLSCITIGTCLLVLACILGYITIWASFLLLLCIWLRHFLRLRAIKFTFIIWTILISTYSILIGWNHIWEVVRCLQPCGLVSHVVVIGVALIFCFWAQSI